MERKRIILLATSDINYDQRLQKVAQSLASLGTAVLLVGRMLAHSIPLEQRDFEQTRVRCIFNKGFLFYLEINIRYFLLLLGAKAQIVCANDPDTLLGAILASYFKSFDLFYDSHEYFTEVPELQNRGLKKSIWASIERWGVRRAKKCYTVNESLANLFSHKYSVNFEVIRNVPLAGNVETIKEKENIILYQGALNKGRGIEVLIRAMTKIDGQLWLAGRGDLQEALQVRVNALGLTHKVHFLGNLLPSELRLRTAQAKIGINLLEKESLNYYYSLANKFFDYMHAGVPSINMAFPEYVFMNQADEVSVLLDDLDENQLCKAIETLLKDEAFYDRLRTNSLAASTKYYWQKEALKLKTLYAL